MTIATVREDGFPHATTVSYVHEGTTLYFGTSSNSTKSTSIALNNKVSLTVNRPYKFWKNILGLTITGTAESISDAAEFRKVEKLIHERFPLVHEYGKAESETVKLFRINPLFISILDYSKGFGHIESCSL